MSTSVKDALRDLLDRLPDDVTWDEIDYAIHVRRTIERGLEDMAAGSTISHEDILKEFGIEPR
jgi:predicted transcriptional regulator